MGRCGMLSDTMTVSTVTRVSLSSLLSGRARKLGGGAIVRDADHLSVARIVLVHVHGGDEGRGRATAHELALRKEVRAWHQRRIRN